MASSPNDAPVRHVSSLERTAYGSGWLFQGILSIAGMSYLSNFYVQVLHADLVKTAFALTIGKLADLFVDAVIGGLSDSTRTRFGRRRIYIAIGGIGWAWTLYLTFNPPVSIRESADALMVFLAVMMFLDTTFLTIFLVPYTALNVDITPDGQERTNLVAVRTWFSAAGKMFGMLLIKPFIGEKFGPEYSRVIMYIAIVMAVGSLIPAIFCRERIQAPSRHAGQKPIRDFFSGAISSRSVNWLFAPMVATIALFGVAVWKLEPIAGRFFRTAQSPNGAQDTALIAVTAVAMVLIAILSFALLKKAAAANVPGASKFLLLLSNGPFVSITIAFVVGTLGLVISGGMLIWVAQFVLGGREASADIMFLAYAIPLLAIHPWKWLADAMGLKKSMLLMLGMVVGWFSLSHWLLQPAAEGKWTLFDFTLPLPSNLPWLGHSLRLHYDTLLSGSALLWVAGLGVANAGLMVIPAAILQDVTDYDTIRSGERRAGIIVGVESFAARLAGAPAQIFSNALIAWSGVPTDKKATALDAGPQAVEKLRILYMSPPIILALFGFVVFLFYTLTPARMREVRRQLAEGEAAEGHAPPPSR